MIEMIVESGKRKKGKKRCEQSLRERERFICVGSEEFSGPR